MTQLTEAKFAQLCAYIATNAAKWAGDMLTLPEDHNQPVDAKTVKRFTDEMRARLDRLDEMAGAVIKAAGAHVDEKDPSTPRAALDAIKTGLRLPPDLRKKIKKAAKLNGRSANSEILVALYTAFPDETTETPEPQAIQDGENELKSIRFHMLLSQSEADAIDKWSLRNKTRSRAEAMRTLCQISLRMAATSLQK